jgi:uncharacterized protein YjbI with pentapeptide repeats
MTASYLRSAADVRRWPADPAARRALEEYLAALPQHSGDLEHELDAEGLDFTGADLSGLDLTQAELSGAMLSGIRLVGADLYGAWLIGATLRGADLSQCRLRKALGRKCDARDAVLRGVELERAEFEDADLRGADLSGARFGTAWLFRADLRGADLRDCVFGTTVGPAGLQRARLAGCNVAGATGRVDGPADVGADAPHLIDGDELREWFTDRGALVEVAASPR